MAARTYSLTGKGPDGLPVSVDLTITDGGTPPPPPALNEIRMKGDRFTPASLAVPVGATVSFVNDDNQSHWIRGTFDLGDQPAGVTKSRVFPTAGTWAYVDAYHGAHGTIEVTGSLPPPGPQLATATFLPAQIKSGQTAVLTATLTGSIPSGGVFALDLVYSAGIGGATRLVFSAGGVVSRTVDVVAGPTFVGAATVTVTDGVVTRTATLNVVADSVPVPGRLNVRDLGIKADGTDEGAAIQKILDGAALGKEIYFPAGRYVHSLPLHLRTPGLNVTGDGPLTEIVSGLTQNFWIGGAGLGTQDVQVRTLTLVGAPGKYRAEGNFGHGILSDSAKNTRIFDVLLLGPGNGIYQSGDAVGLECDNVRVHGFGSVGFGLGDGAKLTNCEAIQDIAPDGAVRPAYGAYIHNGAQDVVIADSRFKNAGSYGCHFWAQADGFPTGPISVLHCLFENNAIGLICANSPATAGRVQGLTVQDCQFLGVVRGSCVVIRQADGVLFERNTIRSGKQAVEMIDCQGLALGQWGPNDPGGVIRNGIFRLNTIDGWDFGLYALASNGGRFENCSVGPNLITNCRNPLRASGIAGLAVVP